MAETVTVPDEKSLEHLREIFNTRWAEQFKRVSEEHKLLAMKYQQALNRLSQLEELLKDLGAIHSVATQRIDEALGFKEIA